MMVTMGQNTNGVAAETPPGHLPVVVIGAGPVGLAAAAHLLERGIEPLVLEAGDAAGATVREWAHVRFFSPWRYVVDPASARLLETGGWTTPDPDRFPTGGDLLTRYLSPLAATPALAARARFDARVTGVARLGLDKMTSGGRAEAPFLVATRATDGTEGTTLARAVIDASGTWTRPNPLGASGLPVPGEGSPRLAPHLRTGIPDVLGAERERYAGKATLVAGRGASAFNVLLDLARLAEAVPGTTIHWVLRRRLGGKIYGGGAADQLPERGALGARVRRLVNHGVITVHQEAGITALDIDGADRVIVRAGDRAIGPVDQIVVTTGFRPDLSFLSEVRLGLDPAVEAPLALAPLIDPNVHSCGTVRPHGAAELAHPEPGFSIVGMKSYGRAPTFLLLTGYEQVRSVAAALAGDHEGAGRVELVLPETGVCSSDPADGDGASCCAPTAGVPAEAVIVNVEEVENASGSCRAPAAPVGMEAVARVVAPEEGDRRAGVASAEGDVVGDAPDATCCAPAASAPVGAVAEVPATGDGDCCGAEVVAAGCCAPEIEAGDCCGAAPATTGRTVTLERPR